MKRKITLEIMEITTLLKMKVLSRQKKLIFQILIKLNNRRNRKLNHQQNRMLNHQQNRMLKKNLPKIVNLTTTLKFQKKIILLRNKPKLKKILVKIKPHCHQRSKKKMKVRIAKVLQNPLWRMKMIKTTILMPHHLQWVIKIFKFLCVLFFHEFNM